MIDEEPRETVATVTYNGNLFERRDEQTAKLLKALEENKVQTIGKPFSQGYNAPYTISYFKTNEVGIKVNYD